MENVILASIVFLISVTAPPSPSADLIRDGRAALAANRVDDAIRFLKSAVAVDPDNSIAHYWLGNAYGREALQAHFWERLSYAGKTRKELERAVQLDPDNIDARFALLQYYTMAPGFVGGSTRKAYEQAEAIQARNPAKGRMALRFVQTHGRSGGMPQSLDDPRARAAQSKRQH